MSILQLFIVVVILLLVMKFIGATIKLMGTAAVITIIAWAIIYWLPNFL